MVDMKPCPFCGGEAVMCGFQDEMMHYVKCRDCGACSDGAQLSTETAAAAWNRRAERTYHPERISTVYHSAIECSECKHRLDDVTIYCPYCGARLEGVGR